jgi:hypothetical protein
MVESNRNRKAAVANRRNSVLLSHSMLADHPNLPFHFPRRLRMCGRQITPRVGNRFTFKDLRWLVSVLPKAGGKGSFFSAAIDSVLAVCLRVRLLRVFFHSGPLKRRRSTRPRHSRMCLPRKGTIQPKCEQSSVIATLKLRGDCRKDGRILGRADPRDVQESGEILPGWCHK